MTRSERGGLGLRITLLFALVYGLVVVLTDALLIINMRSVQADRDLEALEREAGRAARIAAALAAALPAPAVEGAVSAAIEGGVPFDAAVIDLRGATLSFGLGALGLEPSDVPEVPSGAVLAADGRALAPRRYWVASGASSGVVARLVSLGLETTEAVRAFSAQLVLLSGLVAFVGFWAMLMVGVGVSRPVRIMTATASRIAGGDLGARVGLDRSDELGALARTFDRMAARLQQTEAGRRALLSSVSHELKTPLASMRALLDAVLSGDGVPGEARECLELVDREIERLAGLVRSVTAHTRLEEVAPRLSDVGLARAVGRMAALVGPQAAAAGDSVALAVPEDLVVKADPDMLDELLLNLLDNAVRHGGTGTRITVRAAPRGSEVVLEVSNTGRPIAEDDRARLFEPFFTVDPSRARGLGGAGLGLAIVAKIASLHGWSVTAESRCGENVFGVRMARRPEDMVS